MGCFLACFGSKKERRRRRKSPKRVIPRAQRNCDEALQLKAQKKDACDAPLQPDISLNEVQINAADEPLETTKCLNKDCTEKPTSPIVESREKLDEQLSFNTRKKVTFDLNVKAYEDISTEEAKNCTSEDERVDIEEKGRNTTTYPSNHRYQNCSNSDDEYDAASDESDLDDDSDDYYTDDDDEDGDDQQKIVQDESSESFFSLPSALQRQGSETPQAEKEVNSPVPKPRTISSNQNARDRSQYVHSVLNPVENLTQWKAVKMKSKPLLKQEKENTDLEKEVVIPFSSEPSFKQSSPFSPSPKIKRSSESPKEDITVDTSLSNWLGSSETTPSKTSNLSGGIESAAESKRQTSNSPRSHEDRPILGALTIEEIRQFSATSSPRKSPTRSPDEIPILGTVGSYWSHTGQTTATDSSSGTSSSLKGIPNTTSKYREDMRVNWHATPFQTRLERALNSGEPEAYSC